MNRDVGRGVENFVQIHDTIFNRSIGVMVWYLRDLDGQRGSEVHDARRWSGAGLGERVALLKVSSERWTQGSY